MYPSIPDIGTEEVTQHLSKSDTRAEFIFFKTPISIPLLHGNVESIKAISITYHENFMNVITKPFIQTFLWINDPDTILIPKELTHIGIDNNSLFYDKNYRAASKLVTAVWSILHQPEIITEHVEELPPAQRVKLNKKAARHGGSPDRDVNVRTVHLNKRTHDNITFDKTVDDVSQPVRHIEGKRWWVRGHWRNQACGPGLKQRRAIYIAPHLKGDPNAEIVHTEQVTVIKE